MKERLLTITQKEMQAERKWILSKIKEIGEEQLLQLAQSAAETRELAYMPYSNYAVGASLLTSSGGIYSSINAEAVTYSETDHAERSVITKAISDGEINLSGRKFIEAIAVCHSGGEKRQGSGPCGSCRQRIAEHADNALLLDVDVDGEIRSITSLKTLFPYAFTPSHLGLV